jgi:lipopolysaccharide export system ATP-binding protein
VSKPSATPSPAQPDKPGSAAKSAEASPAAKPSTPAVGSSVPAAAAPAGASASTAPAQPAAPQPATAPAPARGPSTNRRAVISTRELVKTYGQRTVVGGVNIRVAAGEIVGLLGPNGAGKTTTFYMIVGLVPATRGQVLLDDVPITKLRMHQRARTGLGYLPQEPSIFRTLTVEENVRAIVETLDLPRRLHAARTKEHLDELGLFHLAKQRAYTLSGGERRRLEIARALVTRPKFLLMDEPFSGVDPISVADVQKIVLELRKRGIGILITDHNVRETLRIVDRAYLIHQGRVLTEGTGEYLITDPKAREFYLGENFNL